MVQGSQSEKKKVPGSENVNGTGNKIEQNNTGGSQATQNGTAHLAFKNILRNTQLCNALISAASQLSTGLCMSTYIN